MGHIRALIVSDLRVYRDGLAVALRVDPLVESVEVAAHAMEPEAADPTAVEAADSPQLFIVGRLAADWWSRLGPDGPLFGARVMLEDPR